MKNMKCPACRSILVITGQERLQTLTEHVENPNGRVSMKDKYECSNPLCVTHDTGICWDASGGMYSLNWKANSPKINWIDNNNGAFGSIERKINVEVYKNDENIRVKIPFVNIVLEIDWQYKADEDGNVLSKKPSLKVWINNTLYISGIRMLIFSIRNHYWKFNVNNKNEDFQYPIGSFAKDWWRWVAVFILRIIDRKTYALSVSK